MQASEFFARALREGRRYGEDAYVFLRELAQNSRDAGADRIDVTTRVEESGSVHIIEEVTFADDGRGMTFEHARDYLFRLYASSKEEDPDAVGHFGVGFWSVLQWEPDVVEVHSRTAAAGWGVRIDVRDGTVETVPVVSDAGIGTRVTLRRERLAAEWERPSLRGAVRAALEHYCRHVRRGRARLRVAVDGERVDAPLQVEGPFSLTFSGRGLVGVVGLSEQPRVELYSRGLLVTTVTFLEELLPGEKVPERRPQARGLSPVVILDSDRLELVLSRRAPVVTKELRRIVRVARARVRRLVDRVIDAACPAPWTERLRDLLVDSVRAAGGGPTLAVGAAWVMAVGMFAWLLMGPLDLVRFEAPEPSGADPGPAAADELVVRLTPPPRSSAPRGYANVRSYRGARVDSPRAGAAPWGLTHDGPPELLFKILTLDHYDAQLGWLPHPARDSRPHAPPPRRCDESCISVRLELAAGTGQGEPLVLPVPTGFRVDPGSVQLDGQLIAPVRSNDAGEALVRVPAANHGVLTYRVGPAPRQRSSEVAPTGVELPGVLDEALRRMRRFGVRGRVARATALIEGAVAYDISPEAAARFAAMRGDWIQKVFDLGAGDCDVKNGLNVIALRQLGIPARMAVGIVTSNGEARAGLHAWTEYWHRGRWHAVDASGTPGYGAPAVAAAVSPARPSSAAPAPVAARSPASTAEPPAPSSVRDADSRPLPAPVPTGPLTEVGGFSSDGVADPGSEVASIPPGGVERPHAVGVSSSSVRPLLLATAVAVLLLALVVVLWVRRQAERFSTAGDDGDEQRALSRILRDALQQPEAWRHATGLWHRRVLPVLRGRSISIADALRRARDGELWMSRKRCPLAVSAAGAGTVVLDAGHSAFGDLVGALGRATDLDALDALLETVGSGGATDTGGHELDGISTATNRLLEEVGASVRCAPCQGLRDAEVLDIDLSRLRLPRSAPWPRRFIALNPRAESVVRRARRVEQDPYDGVFLWVDWLLDRSRLLVDRAPMLRERAARHALSRATDDAEVAR